MSYADSKDARITRMSVLKTAVDTAAATGTVAGVGLAAARSEILSLATEYEAWVNAAKSNEVPAPAGTAERKEQPKVGHEERDDGRTVVGKVETCSRDGSSFKVGGQWYKITAMTRNDVSGELWRQRVRVAYAVGTRGRLANTIDRA